MHATHAPLINLTAVPKHDTHGSQANPGRPEASTQPAPPNSRTARGHTIKPPAYGSVGSYVDRRIEPPRKLQTLSRYGNRIDRNRPFKFNGGERRRDTDVRRGPPKEGIIGEKARSAFTEWPDHYRIIHRSTGGRPRPRLVRARCCRLADADAAGHPTPPRCLSGRAPVFRWLAVSLSLSAPPRTLGCDLVVDPTSWRSGAPRQPANLPQLDGQGRVRRERSYFRSPLGPITPPRKNLVLCNSNITPYGKATGKGGLTKRITPLLLPFRNIRC
jgi:hypothetical protein